MVVRAVQERGGASRVALNVVWYPSVGSVRYLSIVLFVLCTLCVTV